MTGRAHPSCGIRALTRLSSRISRFCSSRAARPPLPSFRPHWAKHPAPPAIPMSSFLPPDPKIESAIRAKGEQLFALMDQQPPPALFSKKGAYARLMDWSMKDPVFKTQLFRFVDVLPSLNSLRRNRPPPAGIPRRQGRRAQPRAQGRPRRLVVRPGARRHARSRPRSSTWPASSSPARPARTSSSRSARTPSSASPPPSTCSARPSSATPRPTSSSSATSRSSTPSPPFFAQEPAPALQRPRPRRPAPAPQPLGQDLRAHARRPPGRPGELHRRAEGALPPDPPPRRRGRRAHQLRHGELQAEGPHPRSSSSPSSRNPNSPQQPAIGIALQAYLRDCEADLRDLVAWARQHQRPLSVRLVKGAYWDYETILAQQRDWPVPVWQKKPESDANYEKLTVLLLENIDLVTPNFASHNVRSVRPRHRAGRAPRASTRRPTNSRRSTAWPTS